MPELPEVECVRRSLGRHLVGREMAQVRVIRRGVVCGDAHPAAMLVNDRVSQLLRHGKQLALLGVSGACVAAHLGMSGQLCMVPRADGQVTDTTASQRTTGRLGSSKTDDIPTQLPAHTHVLWQLDSGTWLRFTDPRRFGGLWTFRTFDELIRQRWSSLGPDALTITPDALFTQLHTTRRGLKAALLDQSVVAGLGNIYVDELLYRMRLHPVLPADRLTERLGQTLVKRMRMLLEGAIERGGSSLRDYVDADNQRGNQQLQNRVYGRAGQPCRRRGCDQRIVSDQIAGRTTAWCPGCQRLPA